MPERLRDTPGPERVKKRFFSVFDENFASPHQNLHSHDPQHTSAPSDNHSCRGVITCHPLAARLKSTSLPEVRRRTCTRLPKLPKHVPTLADRMLRPPSGTPLVPAAHLGDLTFHILPVVIHLMCHLLPRRLPPCIPRPASCRIFSRAWTYLINGYMRALASSDLVRYDMGQAMPTHITTGCLWYRPWRAYPSPCFATLSMPHEHHVVFSHVDAHT